MQKKFGSTGCYNFCRVAEAGKGLFVTGLVLSVCMVWGLRAQVAAPEAVAEIPPPDVAVVPDPPEPVEAVADVAEPQAPEADVAEAEPVAVEELAPVEAEWEPEAVEGTFDAAEAKISVSLDDVDLPDVVRLFTRLTGINIIAATTNLSGSVTANLQDVEWQPALESILERQHLRLVEKPAESGIFVIESQPAGEPEPWVTEVFKLDYLKANEAAEMLQSLLGLGVVDKTLKRPSASPTPARRSAREEDEPVREEIAVVMRKEGNVVSYPAGNSVVVSTTKDKMVEVRNVLQMVDQPRQQVYIEAKIVELRGDAGKKVGIDWSMLDGYKVGVRDIARRYRKDRTRGYDNTDHSEGASQMELNRLSRADSLTTYNPAYDAYGNQLEREKYEVINIGEGIPPIINVTKIPTTEILNERERDHGLMSSEASAANWARNKQSSKLVNEISTAIFEADALSLVISALQTSEDAFLVSNPKVIVANEERAVIDMATKEPYVTVERKIDGTGDNTTYTYSTKMDVIPGDAEENKLLPYIEQAFFTYGIKLEVTPRVNNPSNITVTVSPTLSALQGYYTPGGEGSTRFPRIESKHVRTVFSLGDGQTAVIGGLTTTSDGDVVKKIPLLGDIPILGKYLFSHTAKEKTQRETVIFVTVGIIDQAQPRMALAVPEASKLIHRHVTPDGKLIRPEIEAAQGSAEAALAEDLKREAP